MKRIIAITMILFILAVNQLACASEESFIVDASACNEIKIEKIYNNGSPNPGSTFWDCSYTTADASEMKFIVDFINSMKIVPDDVTHRCSDISPVCINIDDTFEAILHIPCGMCNINGKFYTFDKDKYDAFMDMIYGFKVKKGIEISYYNSGNYGEFYSPLKTGYYTYFTTDKTEIEEIQKCISDIKFAHVGGGFAANGGEGLTVSVKDDKEVYFYLSSVRGGRWLCYFNGDCYSFSIEECRKLEELVFEYKSKDEIKVYLNNQRIKFYNGPVIVNNRALVPAENIAKALGLYVSGGDKSIRFEEDDNVCVFLPGENVVIENSSQKPIDTGCRIMKGIAMTPVRHVAEFFGYDVKWENNSVYITSR